MLAVFQMMRGIHGMDAIKGLIERTVYVEAVIDFLTQMQIWLANQISSSGFHYKNFEDFMINKKDPHVH